MPQLRAQLGTRWARKQWLLQRAGWPRCRDPEVPSRARHSARPPSLTWAAPTMGTHGAKQLDSVAPGPSEVRDEFQGQTPQRGKRLHCQRQASRIASSIDRVAFQPRTRSALPTAA